MEESSYKTLCKRFFLYAGPLYVFFAAVIVPLCFIIDPLQFFHRSWFLPQDMLDRDMRVQAAGIINNYDFDSFILGASIFENTSAHEAGAKLGGTFFNISMSGSNSWERSFPLKKALKRNIRHVIYSIDGCTSDFEHAYQLGDNPRLHMRRYTYLYDENFFNDIFYYITKKNILNMFKKNFGLKKVDLDHPNGWFELSASMFGGIDKWVNTIDNPKYKSFFTDLNNISLQTKNNKINVTHDLDMERRAKKDIDEYILKYAKEYPKTEFYYIFPPYFRYTYAKWLKTDPAIFGLHHEIIKYLVDACNSLPNIHVYGFEDQDFLDDIANYSDPVHYHSWVNSLMLDAIREKKHCLTSENVERYLQVSLEKARNFDFAALNTEAQRLIREREASRNAQ